MTPEFDRDAAISDFKSIARERRRLVPVCAQCGKEIPPGQEVRKGFFRRKSYHKNTCIVYCDME
jgi:hypothetical protein